MIEALRKQYVQKANARPKHHQAIENGDLNKISHQYKTCPEILLYYFWFLLCYNFTRRWGVGWRELLANLSW